MPLKDASKDLLYRFLQNLDISLPVMYRGTYPMSHTFVRRWDYLDHARGNWVSSVHCCVSRVCDGNDGQSHFSFIITWAFHSKATAKERHMHRCAVLIIAFHQPYC